MTTLAAARTALVSAVGAKDDYADPPACLVFSEGCDMEGSTLDGSYLWRFRVACYVAANSDTAVGDVAMNTYLATQVAALRALAGWQLVSVGRTGTAELAGGSVLAADIIVLTKVTLS